MVSFCPARLGCASQLAACLQECCLWGLWAGVWSRFRKRAFLCSNLNQSVKKLQVGRSASEPLRWMKDQGGYEGWQQSGLKSFTRIESCQAINEIHITLCFLSAGFPKGFENDLGNISQQSASYLCVADKNSPPLFHCILMSTGHICTLISFHDFTHDLSAFYW